MIVEMLWLLACIQLPTAKAEPARIFFSFPLFQFPTSANERRRSPRQGKLRWLASKGRPYEQTQLEGKIFVAVAAGDVQKASWRLMEAFLATGMCPSIWKKGGRGPGEKNIVLGFSQALAKWFKEGWQFRRCAH